MYKTNLKYENVLVKKVFCQFFFVFQYFKMEIFFGLLSQCGRKLGFRRIVTSYFYIDKWHFKVMCEVFMERSEIIKKQHDFKSPFFDIEINIEIVQYHG